MNTIDAIPYRIVMTDISALDHWHWNGQSSWVTEYTHCDPQYESNYGSSSAEMSSEQNNSW